MTGESDWVLVARKADIAEGSVQGVPLGDGFVAVYHLQGGAVCATSDVCTHEYARLSEGWLEGGTVVCPLHGGRFDAQTGAAVGRPATCALSVFRTALRGDEIWLEVNEDTMRKVSESNGFN